MRRLILLLALVAGTLAAAVTVASASAPNIGWTTPTVDQQVAPGPLPVEVSALSTNGINRCLLDWRVGTTPGIPWSQVTTPSRPDYQAPYQWSFEVPDVADGTTLQLKASCYDNSSPRRSDAIFRTVVVQHDPGSDPAPPPPPVSDAPVAAFTETQEAGTRYDLDATASTGDGLTYAWEVDGQPLTATAATVQDAGPLQTMGTHHAKLTVTDSQGRSDTVEHDFQVVYRLWPYTAQYGFGDNDPIGTTTVEDFPDWTPFVKDYGPWRNISAVNRTDQGSYSYQPNYDGDPSQLVLEVHQGDHPTSGGGDRAALGLCPHCFNWTKAGYASEPDIQGQSGDSPRFYRVEWKIPSDQPVPLLDVYTKPDGTKVKADIHNYGEWHGFAPGESLLKVGPTDSTGMKWGVMFSPADPQVPGTNLPYKKIDAHTIVPGEWQNYVLEVLWRWDNTGYVRAWRDGTCVTCGFAGADSQGRIYGATLRTLKDGSHDTGAGFNLQHYRSPAFRYPTKAIYRHIAIGRSYDDVMAQG